jgi:hypothetical protein
VANPKSGPDYSVFIMKQSFLFSNFTYPLRCLREPPGVSVPQVEYHCSRPSSLLVSEHAHVFILIITTNKQEIHNEVSMLNYQDYYLYSLHTGVPKTHVRHRESRKSCRSPIMVSNDNKITRTNTNDTKTRQMHSTARPNLHSTHLPQQPAGLRYGTSCAVRDSDVALLVSRVGRTTLLPILCTDS